MMSCGENISDVDEEFDEGLKRSCQRTKRLFKNLVREQKGYTSFLMLYLNENLGNESTFFLSKKAEILL